MEPRPEVHLPEVQALHNPLRLGKPRNHGMGFVRKRANKRRFVEGAENPDDKCFGGGFGEGMDGGDDDSSDLGGG